MIRMKARKSTYQLVWNIKVRIILKAKKIQFLITFQMIEFLFNGPRVSFGSQTYNYQ